MNNIVKYHKLAIMNDEGEFFTVQPKSWSSTTSTERKEIMELLFEGDYKLIIAAVPKDMP
jgi:hypothetical protein